MTKASLSPSSNDAIGGDANQQIVKKKKRMKKSVEDRSKIEKESKDFDANIASNESNAAFNNGKKE